MKASSPLLPLTRSLAFFRAVGGFPLLPDDETAMRWRLHKVCWAFSMLFMTVLVVAYGTIEIYVGSLVRARGFKTTKVLHMAFEEGFTYTDIVIASLSYGGIVVITYIMMIKVYYLDKELSFLCLEITSLCDSLRISESEIKRTGEDTLAVFVQKYAVNGVMIVTFFLCVVVTHVQMDIPVAVETKALGMVVFLLISVWFSWSFVNCAYYLVCAQIFRVLCLQLHTFHSLLRSTVAEECKLNPLGDDYTWKGLKLSICKRHFGIVFKSPIHDLSVFQTKEKGAVLSGFLSRAEIVAIARRLPRLISRINDDFGTVILITVGGCLFFQVNGTFGAFHTIEALASRPFHLAKFSVGIPHILMALIGFLRIHMLFRSGQTMAHGYANVKEALEDYLLANVESMTTVDVGEMEVLIGEFKNRSPIRPKKAFGLNSSSALNVTGLFVTYILVLLQFKLIEY